MRETKPQSILYTFSPSRQGMQSIYGTKHSFEEEEEGKQRDSDKEITTSFYDSWGSIL
jgi:hypothetical protein